VVVGIFTFRSAAASTPPAPPAPPVMPQS
jgi:hypothetical protein